MKKTLLIIAGAFIFIVCYQSILIDRSVSNIPFTPNIFVSSSSVEEMSSFDDPHSNGYSRKLNDTITIYYTITKRVSNNDRVENALWRIKYKNMDAKNLLDYLNKYDLNLFRKSDTIGKLFDDKKKIFINNKIDQYLIGFYNKTDNSFSIIYDYPKAYVSYKDKSTFKTSLKDFFIGAPH